MEDNDDPDNIRVVEVNDDNQGDATITLLPGNYSVTGFSMNDRPFTIPEEEICADSGLFGGIVMSLMGADECVTLPEIEMDSWVSGGIEIENFEVSLKHLANPQAYNTLHVNLVDTGIPQNYDDLQEMSDALADLKLTSQGKDPYFDNE